jgi:N-acetylmuramoyl-L-alanine amidase
VKTVFVSAGHSDRDPGAVSQDGRYREADLAERLRNRIATNLRAVGIWVITDGDGGQNKPLKDAVWMAKKNQGPAIEIHFNAGPPGASGTEVLSLPDKKSLAQRIAGAIAKHMKSPLRGESGWKNDSQGQHPRLAFCQAGGLVVEVCFITNSDELKTYLSLETEIAGAIADELASEVRLET